MVRTFLPLLVAVLVWSGAAQLQPEHHAALVVAFPDGQVETRCVAFAEPEISGFDLLSRSGLQMEVTAAGSLGLAVCSIQGEGCPASNCFCSCTGADCEYWSYWHWREDWEYAQVGAGSYRIGDGDIDGWIWGPGNPGQAIAPPVISYEEICAEPVGLPVETTDESLPSPGPAGYDSLLVLAAASLILALLFLILGQKRKRDE